MMRIRMPKALIFIICLIICVTVSCEINSTGQEESSREVEFPDMIFRDADYLLGMAGNNPIKIHAETIEIFNDVKKALLYDATFRQDDNVGIEIISGSAEFIQIDLKTNDAMLEGSVAIYNHKDQLHILADSLQWHHEDRLLSSKAQDVVILNYDGRYTIEGLGFSGKFDQATYEFLSVVEGEISDNDT